MTKKSEYILQTLHIGAESYQFIPIEQVNEKFHVNLSLIPYSLRILLEGALRNAALKNLDGEDVAKIANWKAQTKQPRPTISYQPGRVLLQDLTGVPVIVDLASLRAAAARAGKARRAGRNPRFAPRGVRNRPDARKNLLIYRAIPRCRACRSA